MKFLIRELQWFDRRILSGVAVMNVQKLVQKEIHRQVQKEKQLIRFLREELAIPMGDLDLALKHPEQTPDLLPIILWQYGLVSLTQLDQIFDWLETKAIVQ